MSESITEELREYAAEHSYWRRGTEYVTMNDILPIADRIDERFDRELRAKQDEMDGLKADMSDLQARLDASMPLPVDADGVPWTGHDVDKPFSLTDGDKATDGTFREIAYAWPREGWWIVDQYDTHYPADKCRHVTTEPHEPPDSQERIDADAKKSACEYFGRQGKGCIGCPAYDVVYTLGDCMRKQMSDLLRRQRELDGAGEQA